MLTLSDRAQYSVEIKRSRFMAYAQRVESARQALEFYEQVADSNANHNCWAYRIDYQYRFNDDGEPGSTAGKPILAAIEGKQLNQTMVIVTRYFGGIKLGVGGLVRAYGGTAAKCLDQAVIIELKPTVECRVKLPFKQTRIVHQLMRDYAVQKLDEQFVADGVVLNIQIEAETLPLFRRALRDHSKGQAVIIEPDKPI